MKLCLLSHYIVLFRMSRSPSCSSFQLCPLLFQHGKLSGIRQEPAAMQTSLSFTTASVELSSYQTQAWSLDKHKVHEEQ